MDELKKKVRSLTSKERRDLYKKGVCLISIKLENMEKSVYEILAVIFSEKELADLSWADEEGLVADIIDKTFGVTKEEAGN